MATTEELRLFAEALKKNRDKLTKATQREAERIMKSVELEGQAKRSGNPADVIRGVELDRAAVQRESLYIKAQALQKLVERAKKKERK